MELPYELKLVLSLRRGRARNEDCPKVRAKYLLAKLEKWTRINIKSGLGNLAEVRIPSAPFCHATRCGGA
jgi:hypothetical protein